MKSFTKGARSWARILAELGAIDADARTVRLACSDHPCGGALLAAYFRACQAGDRPGAPPGTENRQPGTLRLLHPGARLVAVLLRGRRRTTARPAMRAPSKPRGFVLHGLWPQYMRGWPKDCATSERPWVPRSVIDEMADIMPSKSLIIHEYRAHGTCSGLDAGASISAMARDLYEGITIPPRFTGSGQPARGLAGRDRARVPEGQPLALAEHDVGRPVAGRSCSMSASASAAICFRRAAARTRTAGACRARKVSPARTGHDSRASHRA